MSSSHDGTVAHPALAACRAQLDTFLSLLRAANASPAMADAVLLEQMLDVLQRDASTIPLPGVSELLRSWHAALGDLARTGGSPDATDLVRMTLWFTGLQEYLAGRLDHDGCRMLAELPDGIRWLPRLSPGFVHAIARRLELAAPAAPAEAPAAVIDAAGPASPARETVDDAPAFDLSLESTEAPAAAETDTAFAFAIVESDAPTIAEVPAVAIGEVAVDDSVPGQPTDPASDIRHEALAAPPAPEPAAEVAAGDDAPAEDGTLWIGQEELDLTRQAIAEQVLPLTQAWSEVAESDETATRDGIVEELVYQTRLIANVMELIGTRTLERGMLCVNDGLERRDPAFGPEAVATWCSALLCVFEAPGRESGELLAMVSEDLPGFDAAWTAALGDELERIAIGVDPALIARRKTLATVEDADLAPADDVVPSVLEGMFRELPDNAARFGASVRALVATRSPEPIDEAFTFRAFRAALAGRTAPIKAVLLDQRRMSGLGNIYVDEALFEARIRPDTPAADVSLAAARRLWAAARSVLERGIENRGASFKDYVDGQGQPGQQHMHVQVFRRHGKPCYICGAIIVRTVVGGRGTHYCPHCQRRARQRSQPRGA